MELYAEAILDHYRHPHGKQTIQNATIAHEEKNVSCGDELMIELKVEDGVVTEVGWSGEGCAISQAAMSMLSDVLSGKKLDDVESMAAEDIRSLLKVPISARRLKCALLGLHTLKNALQKMQNKEPYSWAETVGGT